jgi:hypothetical protein
MEGLSAEEIAFIYVNHSGIVVQNIPTSCEIECSGKLTLSCLLK